MTNSYDAHPQDLDPGLEGEYLQRQPIPEQRAQQRMGNFGEGDAASIRSRLTAGLQVCMDEAQNLANVYTNLARQLELQIVMVETKK